MLKYDLSRMKQTIELGTMQEDDFSPEPNAAPTFKTGAKIRCGSYILTSSQYENVLLGSITKTTVNVVIRHRRDTTNYTHAKMNDITYKISAIQTDDRVNAFDVLTLTKEDAG